MKSLKKLALATAIAAAPLSVNALEALDDEFLGDVTGQEGITIDKEYMNTIEEFKYVDGDVDGGSVSVKNIDIGNFSNQYGGFGLFTPNGTLSTIQENGMTIDAAANGVVIGGAAIGAEADILDGSAFIGNAAAYTALVGAGNEDPVLLAQAQGLDSFNTAKNGVHAQAVLAGTADASGNFLNALGNTVTNDEGQLVKFRSNFGDGKDIRIGGIEIGNVAGTQNSSIGSITLLNTSNYLTANRLVFLGSGRMGAISNAQLGAMMVTSADQYIRTETKISSKDDGTTGVVIMSEGDIGAQAAFYTDEDSDALGVNGSAGNQVGVLGLANFRITASDTLSQENLTDGTGTYLRGSVSTTTIDVEDGKLSLHQIKDGNTVLGKIFVGDVNAAASLTAPQGILGGIAILGNHWEGTTKIYGH